MRRLSTHAHRWLNRPCVGGCESTPAKPRADRPSIARVERAGPRPVRPVRPVGPVVYARRIGPAEGHATRWSARCARPAERLHSLLACTHACPSGGQLHPSRAGWQAASAGSVQWAVELRDFARTVCGQATESALEEMRACAWRPRSARSRALRFKPVELQAASADLQPRRCRAHGYGCAALARERTCSAAASGKLCGEPPLVGIRRQRDAVCAPPARSPWHAHIDRGG